MNGKVAEALVSVGKSSHVGSVNLYFHSSPLFMTTLAFKSLLTPLNSFLYLRQLSTRAFLHNCHPRVASTVLLSQHCNHH